MYLPSRNIIVTEVAKAGTHSVRTAVKTALGIDLPIAPGHRTLSQIIEYAWRFGVEVKPKETEVVCIVREPMDRLASAANHLHGHDGSYDVKRILTEMTGEKNIYRPTADYLDVDMPTVFFRFEALQDAIEYATGKPIEALPHENKSHKRFKPSDFDCEAVRKFYAKDFHLYEKAKQ